MYSLFVFVFLCIISCFPLSAQWVRCSNFQDPSSVLKDLTAINGNIYAATGSGVYISNNNGNTWTESGLKYNPVISIAANEQYVYVGHRDGGLSVSNNNGITWEKSNLPDSLDFETIAANGKDIFAATSTRLFHSTNNGINWIETNLRSSVIRCIAINEQNIYVGSSNGFFASTNNGIDWSKYNNGLPNHSIKSIAVLDSNIFCAAIWSVFITNKTTLDWKVIHSFDDEIKTFVVHANKIFAGTDYRGVFYSKDNAITWIDLGLSGRNVRLLVVNDNTLFAGVSEDDLWKLDLNSLTSVEEQTNAHNDADLMLSPNPNNGMLYCTLNSYQDNVPSSLEIYSMQGEKVLQQIIEQPSMTVDISHIPTGIYYVIAHSGNQSTRQVLSLVK